MSSVWWTREWTLQELIAPSRVCFYSRDWKEIGTKDYLSSLIAEVTGIDQKVLQEGNVGDASVAQRMCWASKRKTTRIEDMAYCLMGIFELNMPLLYGEGEKAFMRLQEEIIRNVDNHSIFAWTSEETSQFVFRGLLAKSTSEFRDCSGMVAEDTTVGEPYLFTNRGLKIAFPIRQIQTKHGTPSMEFFCEA